MRLLIVGIILEFQPEILTLQWPSGVNPTKLTDFEYQARKMRYQALGRACYSNKLPALGVGHHADDTVETVLMRMASGHRGLGLHGMSNIAQIPECHGIYGVCESGTPIDYGKTEQGKGKKKGVSTGSRRMPLWFEHLCMDIESGGVSLLRPLLDFPKSRLEATCRYNDVHYVTDRTNFDPTLTSRNTIRHLISSGSLPQALQPRSVMSLIAKTRSLSEHVMESVDYVLGKIDIIKLDLRTGTLVVRFPHPYDLQPVRETGWRGSPEFSARDRFVQAIAIRRIIDLISPHPANNIPIHKLHVLLLRLFPPSRIHDDETTTLLEQDVFTLNGVKFQPVTLGESSNSLHPRNVKPYGLNHRKQRDLVGHVKQNSWVLNREPFSGRSSIPTVNFDINIVNTFASRGGIVSDWSEWKLWDNRYWISVQAVKSPDPPYEPEHFRDSSDNTIYLIVRPLEKKDISSIHQTLQHYQKFPTSFTSAGISEKLSDRLIQSMSKFQTLLKNYAPGDVRFTLPVLAEAGGRKRALALPSMNNDLPVQISLRDDDSTGGFSNWRINWKIHYKYFDLNMPRRPVLGVQ